MQDEFVRKATIVEVIDGDTIRCHIDLGWGMVKLDDIRIANIDTPEIRGWRAQYEGEAGQAAKAKVAQLVHEYGSDVVIRSKSFAIGKYGRCIADVWFPGCDESLGSMLVSAGLAWKTDDDGRVIGPRSLEYLG